MLMRSPLARDRRRPPGFIRPCKPVLSLRVPVGPEWIHELKHDGFKIVANKDGDEVRLWSRNGRDWSAEFVAITAAVIALPFARIVLDGEAVAAARRAWIRAPRPSGCASAYLYAFDLLRPRRTPSALRAPRAPPQAPEEGGTGADLLRAHGEPGRRGDVPPRLRHGPRGHRMPIDAGCGGKAEYGPTRRSVGPYAVGRVTSGLRRSPLEPHSSFSTGSTVPTSPSSACPSPSAAATARVHRAR